MFISSSSGVPFSQNLSDSRMYPKVHTSIPRDLPDWPPKWIIAVFIIVPCLMLVLGVARIAFVLHRRRRRKLLFALAEQQPSHVPLLRTDSPAPPPPAVHPVQPTLLQTPLPPSTSYDIQPPPLARSPLPAASSTSGRPKPRGSDGFPVNETHMAIVRSSVDPMAPSEDRTYSENRDVVLRWAGPEQVPPPKYQAQ